MTDNKQENELLVDEAGALRRLGGDRQLLDEFITIFNEDSPVLLEGIRAGLESRDSMQVRRNAHALKGLVSNFGAEECVKLARRIELAGRADSVDDCCDDFDKLVDLIGQVSNELRSLQVE